jgi:mRNA-degrading endonuclease RelE of RelBE toxin-antitoxin system
MVDKIQKVLDKLSSKEKKKIKEILKKIKEKDFKRLDIKKLKKRRDIFRVRKGRFRIIFMINKKGIKILTLERRKSKTYK